MIPNVELTKHKRRQHYDDDGGAVSAYFIYYYARLMRQRNYTPRNCDEKLVLFIRKIAK